MILNLNFLGRYRIYCLCLIVLFGAHLTANAQSKQKLADRILFQLSNSLEVNRGDWQFSFSGDKCDFKKQIHHKEQDGATISIFQVSFPLRKLIIEEERKKYDTFFQCRDGKKCIESAWVSSDGQIKEKKPVSVGSFYFSEERMRKTMFKLFSQLQSLCDRTNYAGPSGLEWGEDKSPVRIKLSGRFKFLNESMERDGVVLKQKYNGIFSGIQTKAISARFIDRQFFEMNVLPEVPAGTTFTDIWLNIVQAVIDKYGYPDELELPVTVESIGQFTDKKTYQNYDIFDTQIKASNWKPEALWKFKNKAVIAARVLPVGENWEVSWNFYHDSLKQRVLKVQSEQAIEDF